VRDITLPVNLDKRQIIITVVGYNVMCIVLHLISDPPQPTTGSYLHGGLTIEFIGVRALNSRVPLIIWDCIVFLLQLSAFSMNFPPNVDGQLEDDEQPDETAVHPYSGQLMVRDLMIMQAVTENWRQGAALAAQTPSDAQPTEPPAITGAGLV
jgi:hypothetical protein